MIAHIVLFQPKAGVADGDRDAMFAAMRAAATQIPSVRRFHIGRRITHGAAYERLGTRDFPYSAVVEFDDLSGLQTYLQHPAHDALGKLFYALLDEGLVYDYEMSSIL